MPTRAELIPVFTEAAILVARPTSFRQDLHDLGERCPIVRSLPMDQISALAKSLPDLTPARVERPAIFEIGDVEPRQNPIGAGVPPFEDGDIDPLAVDYVVGGIPESARGRHPLIWPPVAGLRAGERYRMLDGTDVEVLATVKEPFFGSHVGTGAGVCTGNLNRYPGQL